MFCESCGQNISETVKHCPYCGQATGTEPTVSGQSVGSSGAGAAAVLQKLPKLTHPKLESGIAGFVRPVLQALEQGSVIRKLTALFLRLGGILSAAFCLYLIIEIAKDALQTQEIQATIADVILAILVLAWGFAAFLIYFYRAAVVASLPDSPFTVIPIISTWVRAVGELWSTGFLLAGIGGCIFFWFTGRSPGQLLGPLAPILLGGEVSIGPFLDGLRALLLGFIGGFGLLLFAYFVAEYIVVVADIAQNVRALVRRDARS